MDVRVVWENLELKVKRQIQKDQIMGSKSEK